MEKITFRGTSLFSVLREVCICFSHLSVRNSVWQSIQQIISARRWLNYVFSVISQAFINVSEEIYASVFTVEVTRLHDVRTQKTWICDRHEIFLAVVPHVNEWNSDNLFLSEFLSILFVKGEENSISVFSLPIRKSNISFGSLIMEERRRNWILRCASRGGSRNLQTKDEVRTIKL